MKKNIISLKFRLHVAYLVMLLLSISSVESYAKYSIRVISHDLATTPEGEGKLEVTADGHTGPYTVFWPDNTTSLLSPIEGVTTAIKGGLSEGVQLVTIENAHGCLVEFQAIINEYNRPLLSISAFLEGPYNSTSDQMDNQLSASNYVPLIEPYSGLAYPFPENSGGSQMTTESIISQYGVVDWIVVEVHDHSGLTWARSGLLLSNGKIVDVDGVSDLELPINFSDENSYYISLHHRNHLDVKMNDPIQVGADSIYIDFSNPALNTTGQKSLHEHRVGLIAGDANYDNCVNPEDGSVTWEQRNLFGYLHADLNLDGMVNAIDRSIAANNNGVCYDFNEYSESNTNCIGSTQNIWIGPELGETWSASASNWSKGSLPTYCDDVLIPSGYKVAIHPLHPAECSTLKVEIGAELDVPVGAILNVDNL